MRSVLVGAVESSYFALQAMTGAGYPPTALVTLPPSLAARHSDWVDLSPAASLWSIPVLESTNINAPDVLARLRELEPDYIFVIGWSQICGPEFLSVPTVGTIGSHPSRLPLNRGRAVIPWTILQGCSETAMTLFWLDDGLDTGDILAQQVFPIAPDESARSLYNKHLSALGEMLHSALPLLERGHASRRPQDHEAATYCAKRTPEDGRIDWRASAWDVTALIRASTDPYPGAFSFMRKGRLTIWESTFVGPGRYWGLPGQVQAVDLHGALVQCGDREHVLLRTVQLNDEPRRPASEILRTHDRLDSHDRWDLG